MYDISNFNYKCISNTIIDTIPEGETFIELEGEIIKTDKAYYKIDIKNEEECKMYIDVKPVYGLIKIDDISSDYDNIKYFNGSYIIYKDDMENLYIYN